MVSLTHGVLRSMSAHPPHKSTGKIIVPCDGYRRTHVFAAVKALLKQCVER